jgi:hypothetical protein
LFGGYSVGSLINGAWKSNHTVYKDTNINVNILVDKYDGLLLSNLYNMIKERFKQLSVYMTIQDIGVVDY